MPTFIYAPGVKVFIYSSRQGVGLVDVSEDLVEGSMTRRQDGVSSLNFSLNNQQRKYDSVFAPNDRVVVVMKRLAWLRTFTGLLNSVPLVSAWPRVVPLSASCSLKRLQYWYWDSDTVATQNLILKALGTGNGQQSDGGIANIVISILTQVVGWPSEKIHIAQIPANWFKIAEKIAQDVEALSQQSDELTREFATALTSRGVIAGQAVANVSGKLQPGNYGGTTLNADQCRIAETIYSVCVSLGGSNRDAVIGMITALQESGMRNLSGGDRDSVGVFQQRPSQGWGTVAQCMDPTYAATKFFMGLLQISNRDSMSETQAAQAVQRSAYPSAYQKWVPTGEAIVRQLIGSNPASVPSTAADIGGARGSKVAALESQTAGSSGSTTPAASGQSTGYNFAQVALDLVTRYPSIPYVQGDRSPSFLAQEPPKYLDCSSLVMAVYMRTLGGLYGLPTYTQAQIPWLKAQGSPVLSYEDAMKTAGALVYMNNDDHVEVSLGDGVHRVAATRPGQNAAVQAYTPSTHAYGLLLPRLTYNSTSGVVTPSGSGTSTSTDPGSAQTQDHSVLASTLPGYNPNDPIDQLFGNNNWSPRLDPSGPATQRAEALTGIRALLNDKQLMPYIKNLFNSTMRAFCSAPNGDLIAWLPDYYGIWGTAAKMIIEPIELQDFTVDWADDYFVTHQFTIAGQPGATFLDLSSGSIADPGFATTGGADILTQTMGVASIDIPAILWALFGIEATPDEANNFTDYIYRRFGARPNFTEMPGIQGPKGEFFSAIYQFMRQWAYQYNADIPMTFMPELWPGMLVQIPAFDFQAYVVSVTHTWRFGSGGGFTTSVNIAAPARLPKSPTDRDNVLFGLPLAGDFRPGHGVSNVDLNPAELLDASGTN